MTLTAEVVSSSVLSTLPPEPRGGTVHSVYRHATNILCRDMTWLCLHPQGVPLHPYSIQVGLKPEGLWADEFLGTSVREEAEVSRTHIDLGRGRLTVVLEGAGVWESKLNPFETLSEAEPYRALDTLDELVEGIHVESPFLAVLTGKAKRPPELGEAAFSAVHLEAARVIRQMEISWTSASLEGMLRAARRAVGMGFGLTPSGDDFLTGMLAASYCFAFHDEFRMKVFEAMRPLIHRTSLPSFFMLKAALHGLYPEPVATLLSALGHGDSPRLRAAFDRLVHAGATSGQDLLAGILCWLRIATSCGAAHAAY